MVGLYSKSENKVYRMSIVCVMVVMHDGFSREKPKWTLTHVIVVFSGNGGG